MLPLSRTQPAAIVLARSGDAAAFDIILTAANVMDDAAGPTVELTVRYRRPTLIGVESLLSAVTADALAGTRHRPNAEIMAQGIANIDFVRLDSIGRIGALPPVEAFFSVITLQHNPPPVMARLLSDLMDRGSF